MYTQCPDCSTAFRVTAEVLRQAAGKVRCGGCSNAFDALSYLSEQMPQQSPEAESASDIPELTPEVDKDESALPRSISAEQSAALLKTLDQLAGSDIRIEDTGVEWRVLDDAEVEEVADIAFVTASENDVQVDAASLESALDELLEDSPTPVDEFLTKTPEVIDAAEIFDGEDESLGEDPSVIEVAQAVSIDELRFDDNTPLPDDFDIDNDSSPKRRATDFIDQDEPQDPGDEPLTQELYSDAERQNDITLSEPEEWQDILGEFEEIADDLRQPAGQAVDEIVDELADDRLEEPLDDRMAEANETDADVSDTEISSIELQLDEELVLSEAENEVPEHVEGDDLLEEGLLEDHSLEENSDLDDDSPGDVEENEIANNEIANNDAPAEEELSIIDELAALETLEEEASVDAEQPLPDDLELDDASADDDIVLASDTDLDDENSQDEVESDDTLLFGSINDEPEVAEQYVPPQSEEEQTVNRLIDQELMALAIEDKDGFASTIIIPPEEAEASLDSDSPSGDELSLNQTSDGFETIVMEGEVVRNALDDDLDDRSTPDADTSAEIAKMIDEHDLPPPASGQQRRRLIGGVIALSLLIVVQVLHQSRQALATNPAFNSTMGPIYRALGAPLQPEWDVTGWRFEATTDITQDDVVPPESSASQASEANRESDSLDDNTAVTDNDPQRLTVYSIIGNKSESSLPYPLIAISLTDRYDATIGNTLLAPEDYLPRNQDTNVLVAAGNSFNALINVEPLPDAATGFKLDVCYRQNDVELRCALEDFK